MILMDNKALSDKWFLCTKPRHQPAMRLFCFAHAGGGATTYHRWNAALGEEVEIHTAQLPGRENRSKERFLESIPEVVVEIVQVIQASLDLPYALFGHSMGALVAYEVSRALQKLGARSPLGLFVSGRRSPDITEFTKPLHVLEDSAFIDAVQQRYGGIPELILKDPEFLSYFIRPMRADFKILETYEHQPDPVLDISIEAYYGREDKRLSLEKMEGWRNQTSSSFALSEFSGGHFFLHDQPDEFLVKFRAHLQ